MCLFVGSAICGWDQDLPVKLLSAEAKGRDELKAMREVNHTCGKAHYEASLAKL